MTDPIVGLLGVVAIFAFTFVWCWVEERAKRRAKRKYDEQMAKYDRWKTMGDNM
tara:strand:- start:668 stop:829 length:162 start_codon:yes stop_codon:yes gene_type:complete